MISERAGRPVTVGGLTLIPLLRVTLSGGAGARLWVSGTVVPAGLAVCSDRGLACYDEVGRAVPPEECLQRFEGLAELAARRHPSGPQGGAGVPTRP